MQLIWNYSQRKWQLGFSLQVVEQDLRYKNLFVETSNAFLRKACTISMMIPGMFRFLFCVFLIFVSEFASLLCQVSENSNAYYFWILENVLLIWENIFKSFVDFLNFWIDKLNCCYRFLWGFYKISALWS